MFPDISIDGRFARAIWGKNIYNAHVKQLARRVDVAASNQLFRDATPNLAPANCKHPSQETS
jgi:hypothetical protein